MASLRHIVFGTAGHVDHGKSALVLALTGTDPDRLAEEKAREMTIDLGFAFLALPGLDGMAAIVDVPGHEMFVRNMVAGATGIDAAIFVVAADEGVKPQTVEHLEVLRQLRVPAGVVALTKLDKVSPGRLSRAAEEVRELTRGTFLESAAVVPVSAVTGEGIDELKAELARIAAAATTRAAEGIFRLPIDRVFTMRGAGTVVTGTVISGAVRVGETVSVLPGDRLLRVRGLQVHGQQVARISAGQRAAVNLADVAKEKLTRGDVLATPGALSESLMVDARLNLSAAAPRALEQRARVRVHCGTAEVMARVVMLAGGELRPGESALVQLRLESALAPAAGDVFVIRSYSPMAVIGGGVIVDPHPPKRRGARGAEEVAERERLPVEELMLELLDRAGPRGVELVQLQQQLSLPEEALRSALETTKREGRAQEARRGLWLSAAAIAEMKSVVVAALARLHAAKPLQPAVALNAVAAEAAPAPESRACLRLALESLAAEGRAVVAGDRVRLADHETRWTDRQAAARERLLRGALPRGLAAPSVQEYAAATGLREAECQEILEALVAVGEMQLLASGIYIHPQAAAEGRSRVIAYLHDKQRMTVADARALLGASRKYLLPFLEQLDREGVTVREGDCRVLARRERTEGKGES
jgi:selenocysteine-specific elongation factor